MRHHTRNYSARRLALYGILILLGFWFDYMNQSTPGLGHNLGKTIAMGAIALTELGPLLLLALWDLFTFLGEGRYLRKKR